MKEMKVRLTFIEEILGTAPSDKEIYGTFIGSKAPDAPSREEEIEALGGGIYCRKQEKLKYISSFLRGGA